MTGAGTRAPRWGALLLLAAAASAPPPATAQDATALVGRAGRIYRSLSSLAADFVQVIQDRAQGDTLTSRGTMIQAGTSSFAMRFSDPPGEAIVVDGEYIWTYTPSTAPNQVYRARVPADPVYGVNLLAVVLDRPQDRYQARYLRRDTLSGHSVDVIELTPGSSSVPFRRARVWLGAEDALPRRIELDEAPGLARILTFTGLRPNAPFTRRTFRFEVPAGVRVIDQG
jgi:outer membrane lipoprotein-sorting protein